MQRLFVLLAAATIALGCSSNDDPTAPADLVAVVVSSAGIGSGTVTAMPGSLDCEITDGVESGICAVSVPTGTAVTFHAQWSVGMQFGGWGDDCEPVHIAIECIVVANAPVSVTAAFVPAIRNDLLYLTGPPNIGELQRRYGGSNQVQPVLPAGTKVAEMAVDYDGTKVALVRRDDTGAYSVWTMKPDGSQLVPRLADEHSHRYPSYSPDGTRIAFMSTRASGAGDIWVANADGSNATNLTPELPGIATLDRSPVWSPDGTRIAFISNRTGFSALWMMNADGSNQVRVTSGVEGELEATWSPDSRTVAFTRGYPDQTLDIVVRDLVSGEETRIARAGTERHPAWSPDGSRIAFASNADGDFEIYTMNPAGGELARLTDNDVDDTMPVWLRARGPAPSVRRDVKR